MYYNYRENVKNDVINAILENYSIEEIARNIFEDRDDFEQKLNDDLWIDDSVTGNASGSYTCNTWKAEENICHNWDLIEESANAFGIEAVISDGYERGPEYWDVSIRCYLLYSAISEALEELEESEEIASIIEMLEREESESESEKEIA